MSPEPLVQAFRDDLDSNLVWLLLLHLGVVIFAGSILLARAVVPSLVYTGHASERVGRVRPAVYAAAAAAGVAVIIIASLWLGGLNVLTDIFDRTWY